MESTEDYQTTETKLKRIASLSAADRGMVFTQVIHHFNVESLQTCYHELDGRKARGSDGVEQTTRQT